MTTPTWVDLAPTVEPVRADLQIAIGKTVTFGRAPKAGAPPFTVLQIVGDPRTFLTMDGGIPVDVTWQLDHIAETPLQALAMGDKANSYMMFGADPVLPHAAVVARELVGDGRPDMIGEGRYLWQHRFRWTLIATL